MCVSANMVLRRVKDFKDKDDYNLTEIVLVWCLLTWIPYPMHII